jgi:hypothetical protein
MRTAAHERFSPAGLAGSAAMSIVLPQREQ